LIHTIKPAAEIIKEMITEFNLARKEADNFDF